MTSITHYGDHANLELYLGLKLASKRLEGTGKSLRRIKILSGSDMDEKEFGRPLKKAASLVKRGVRRRRYDRLVFSKPATSSTSP